MSRIVKVLDLGRMDYRKCLRLQRLVSEGVRLRKIPDTVIVVEHDPVYTVGIREKQYSREEEEKLKDLGAEFHRVDRGGLITFHGPGQLVAYPILDLRNYQLKVRCYVRRLEDTVIDICKAYSINAQTSPLTGVWVDDMKICALGIRVGRHVTTHGLALNCNIDLRWFSHIIPCGIEGKSVTSLSHALRRDITVRDALPKFRASFQKFFSSELVTAERDEITEITDRLERSPS